MAPRSEPDIKTPELRRTNERFYGHRSRPTGEGPDPPILDCIMSIITLAILVVSFGLLGAMVAWFAYEDVARRARLTHQRPSHRSRRAF